MGDFLQPWHLMLLLFISGLMLIPVILYILTLTKAMGKCTATSRTMDPALFWLVLVPIINLVFNFFVILAVSKSLRNEFNRRGIPVADPEPGQGPGMAMCICNCCSVIPLLGLLASLAGLVLWIVYWVKISEYSRMLDMPVQPGLQQ